MFSQTGQATLSQQTAQQQAPLSQPFLSSQQQQPVATAQSQPFLGTFAPQSQQPSPLLGHRAQQPAPPPQQQQPFAAWSSANGAPSAAGGAPGQPNAHMEVDATQQLQLQQEQQPWPQAAYRFPAIDAGLVLYLCSRCKVRTHARFAKNWREVKMPRTGELLYSPGMLICGKCAEFNVKLRRHVEASS